MVATDLLTGVTVLLTLWWLADLVVGSVRMATVPDGRTQPEEDFDV